MRRLSLAAARRMALAAQGFCDPRPTGAPTVRHFRRVMDRMTVLQLDSVNVLCRSHYLPVLARLGPYDRDKLDRFLYHSGENWEYLTHEASITSQALHPYMRWRMASVRWRAGANLEKERPAYVQAVRDEVVEHGPLSVKQLQDPGRRTGPWWGQSKGKVALEWLYASGRLAISHRDQQFITHYDLPERVIRLEHLEARAVDDVDAHRHLLMLAARSMGVATVTDLADYVRLRNPVARPLVADLVAEGALEPMEVEGWDEPGLVHPEAKRPRAVPGRTLLSPFDPVVWCRDRALRLFDFHYRIEIYVPEPKRVFGYYVLPFLLDGELAARVDLKADRKARVLRVQGSYAEPDVDAEVDGVADNLADALTEMAGWLDLDGVEVMPKGDLAPLLTRSL
ncbi:MAG: crosslink repair DNA glycosylase YcaQ family protein [Actinomycetota bacterium]